MKCFFKKMRLESFLNVHPEKYRNSSARQTRSTTPVDLSMVHQYRSRSVDYLNL
ncbi:unnamed protein product [Dracunculus medinensis]|uniref:Uncharacterized protein n=1 Tax=Dracunculus medinensis TaxID=318479 RepID=A0A3P7PH85_DRAME|nr:unnamed protein product [Dracunculus medinensis]